MAPELIVNSIKDTHPVKLAVEYVGIGKVLAGAAAGIVFSTFGIASALNGKTSNVDFHTHVREEERRMYSLESKQDILDTLQRISITQQSKVELKLDQVLAAHGHSFVPSQPIVLPTPIPMVGELLPSPSPRGTP